MRPMTLPTKPDRQLGKRNSYSALTGLITSNMLGVLVEQDVEMLSTASESSMAIVRAVTIIRGPRRT